MLRLEVRHIFRTERPTNFKLGTQTEHENPQQTLSLSSDLKSLPTSQVCTELTVEV